MTPEPAADGFPVPVGDRYFEDYTAGTTHEYGGLTDARSGTTGMIVACTLTCVYALCGNKPPS